jgi:hypothetical protein
MNKQFKMKVQLGDKTKILAKGEYTTIIQLREAAVASYPKRLKDKQITLKYIDQEGDWLYLSEDEDLQALTENIASLNGKKVKLVIEVEQNVTKQVDNQVEEIKQALEDVSLEDKVMTEEVIKVKEVNFEDLKDFKFADVAEQLEQIFNSEEEFGKGKLMKAFKDAAQGTKAEPHIMRLMNKMGKHGHGGRHGPHGPHGPHGAFRKHGGHSCRGKSGRKDESSSSPDQFQGPCFGPMAGYGPMAGGFGPHCGGRGKRGPHHAKKMFRKFMKACRSSSSDSSSSEELKQLKQQCKEWKKGGRKEWMKVRPIITEQSNEVITGKTGATVNCEITLKNGSPFPLWLSAIRKIEGESIQFEDVKVEGVKLFGDKEHKINLSVTLPATVGDYSAKFGFYNKHNKLTGEVATIAFKAIE